MYYFFVFCLPFQYCPLWGYYWISLWCPLPINTITQKTLVHFTILGKNDVYRGKTPKTKSITRKLMALLNHRYLREIAKGIYSCKLPNLTKQEHKQYSRSKWKDVPGLTTNIFAAKTNRTSNHNMTCSTLHLWVYLMIYLWFKPRPAA